MNATTSEYKTQFEVSAKKTRSSNLELYRIVCMFFILAGHYVFNSGLVSPGGPIDSTPNSANSIFLRLFGMWGKTGINCFLMITGYYMCTSHITLRKFLKLLLQIYLYKILIYSIFLYFGHETFCLKRIVQLISPFWDFNNNFISCFIAFYLLIPFLSILVQNLTKKQHFLLLVLLLCFYTILGSLPSFHVSYNYITWFGVLFIISSYIRLHPILIFNKRSLWGWVTLINVILAMTSVLIIQDLSGSNRLSYFFVIDSNKVLAVVVAVSSFLWFKNMDIKYSKFINSFGAATFGVLLIHANSGAMRKWLWEDVVDCVGHYSLPFGQLVLYYLGVSMAVFLICNLIDQLRIATIEKWFFNWYDRKLSAKADKFVNRLIGN